MSATRDPDQLLQAFLDEGPEALPDRTLVAIADDVHRLRQRTAFGPGRFVTMPRAYLAAAGVVVVIAVGALAGIWLTRPSGTNLGGATPPPSEIPMPTGVLQSGARYHPILFSVDTPLTFVVPSATDVGPFQADTWDSLTFRLRGPAGLGAITFHDDVRLQADLCQSSEVITDVPATPEAVGLWLRSDEGVSVSEPMTLTVDGRQALAFDVQLGPDCYDGGAESVPGHPVIAFARNERHRVYAIPTGNDTILVATWGGGYQGEGETHLDALNAATDQLVESMNFD
jgi:hypothetical protein